MPFEIIPAIDIRGGLCVRLFQGDYSQETVYSDDPVSVALRWQACGAPRIHVVDLDGAAAGHAVNAVVIEAICNAVTVPIEMGGGVRSLDGIGDLLRRGVGRVVLGTAAVEDPGLVAEAVRLLGDRLVIGVDARDGMVAVRGWKTTGQVSALALVADMERLGVARFIYTDIARDGALTGPNFFAIQELVAGRKSRIIASGGIASVEHLRRLAGLGVEGAIVGKAAYTGAVDIAEAVRMAAAEKW